MGSGRLREVVSHGGSNLVAPSCTFQTLCDCLKSPFFNFIFRVKEEAG